MYRKSICHQFYFQSIKQENKKNDQVLNEIKYLILVNGRKKQKRASYVTVK